MNWRGVVHIGMLHHGGFKNVRVWDAIIAMRLFAEAFNRAA